MTVKEAMKTIHAFGMPDTYNLEDILNDMFIQQNTDCKTADELFGYCQATFENQNDFDNLDISYFDKMIQEHSKCYSDYVSFVRAAIYQKNLF